MIHSKTLIRPIALLLASVVLLPAAAMAGEKNRSLQSERQPVVSYQSFTYDVRTGSGDLTADERSRLEGWFSSIGLGYGDHISIAAGSYASSGARDGIGNVVARRGLLIEEDETATAGTAPDGAVRLVIRRAIATVPGCPNWSDTAETDMSAGASRNYGCGVNTNLAAMIANPEDLVRGASTDSDLRTARSNRAIQSWSTQTLTGAGGLKTITSGGN